jgi:hypothetical protein
VTAQLQLAVLYLAPALLLWPALWSGRYPGERLMLRRRAPRRVRLRRAPGRIAPRVAAPLRPGLPVLARRLAGRGPPGCAF